jgi:uncharacterized protein YbjT (DUF2867 family)
VVATFQEIDFGAALSRSVTSVSCPNGVALCVKSVLGSTLATSTAFPLTSAGAVAVLLRDAGVKHTLLPPAAPVIDPAMGFRTLGVSVPRVVTLPEVRLESAGARVLPRYGMLLAASRRCAEMPFSNCVKPSVVMTVPPSGCGAGAARQID